MITACDNDEGTPDAVVEISAQDSIQNYKGNFISTGNAAVLKGDKFIYQVSMNPKALSLRDSLKKYSGGNQILQPIVVKGKVINNSMEGYSQIIEITEIIEISGRKDIKVKE